MSALVAAYAVALGTALSALEGLSAQMGGPVSRILCGGGHIAGGGAPDQPLCPGGGACAMAGCPGEALRGALPETIPTLPPAHGEGSPPARLGPGADDPARGRPAA